MNREKMMTILLGPHLSEKSSRVSEKTNQVVFRVRTDAKKSEIRQAVEALFEVKVDSVQVMNQKGKSKRFKGVPGRRPNWKKAYVCLAEGSEIDFVGAD